MGERLPSNLTPLEKAGSSIGAGVGDALPVMLGYIPIAVAYGVLAVQAGVPPGAAVAMSVLVYAGASQFMAVGMVAAGGSATAIVLATLVVNLRHLLMSAALGTRLDRVSMRRLAAIAFHLTDETFAVMVSRQGSQALPLPWMAGLQWSAYLAWVGGSAAGALAGSVVADPSRWGLDFALTAMFIALLVMQVRSAASVAVALGAAFMYKVAGYVVPGHWAVIVAAAVAAGGGAMVAGADDSRGRKAPGIGVWR